MKVVGTRSRERRRNKRLTLRPITVEFDGKSYETADWGLGGFLIEGYAGSHMPDDCLYVTISVDDGRQSRRHIVEIKVIRLAHKHGELAANFINLGDDVFDTLEGWLSGRLTRDALNDPTD